MTAKENYLSETQDSTDFDKTTMKVNAANAAADRVVARIEDAQENSDTVLELVDELYKAQAELSALTDLLMGDQS